MAWVLLLEKIDGMTLAALAAGSEEADVWTSRERLDKAMAEPLRPGAERTPEERDLREALGLSP